MSTIRVVVAVSVDIDPDKFGADPEDVRDEFESLAYDRLSEWLDATGWSGLDAVRDIGALQDGGHLAEWLSKKLEG